MREERVQLEIELGKRESEMREVRKKKIKHAEKIHREGRVFVEGCLVERTSPHTNLGRQDDGKSGDVENRKEVKHTKKDVSKAVQSETRGDIREQTGGTSSVSGIQQTEPIVQTVGTGEKCRNAAKPERQ